MSETRPQAPNGASLVGEVLGSYRLIGELSRGGMGTVYRAQHELLGRPAAIKLLRPELSSNDVLVQRFFNEAKAATAIRHPGIIEVYDFGYTDDGRAYLVMEFLDGEPLRERIARRGRLTELETVSIARGIANALKAAHAKGIIHRDLKPDNVFLVPDPDGSGDRVKVLDFGVAKLADAEPTVAARHTQTGMLMGTPLYMAPEQARAAGTIDHRADLYSLGCILYELLVGKPPFLAEGAGEIIALQLFGQAQRPSERAPGLTPETDAIVMRLLEKEPHQRYANAGDVQNALASVGAHLSARLSAELGGGESRPLIPPTPIANAGHLLHLGLAARPPDPEKRSALAIIAGTVTVVVAAAVVFFVLTRSGERDPVHHADTDALAPNAIPNPGGGAAAYPGSAGIGTAPRNPGDGARAARSAITASNPGGVGTQTGVGSNPGGVGGTREADDGGNPGGVGGSTRATGAGGNPGEVGSTRATGAGGTPGGVGGSNPGGVGGRGVGGTRAVDAGGNPGGGGRKGSVKVVGEAGGRKRETVKTVGPTPGPVVKPDVGETTKAEGPTTHTGMHTSEGAPIEPDLGEPRKKDP